MNLTPGLFNFGIYPGAALNIVFLLQDIRGNPIDVTGCTAELMCRYKKNPITPFLTASTGAGSLINNGLEGYTLYVPDSVTAPLAIGNGFFDLKNTQPNGDSKIVLSGNSNVKLVSST
jgi:hypothetical protein